MQSWLQPNSSSRAKRWSASGDIAIRGDAANRTKYGCGFRRSGAIVAILFGGSVLHAPPASDVNNKILWVARKRNDFGAMHIRAQRMRGATLSE